MSIESELVALREAVERLTAAITGHAETRLAIFNRAGEEALEAIPFNGAEIAAEINAETNTERQAVAANDAQLTDEPPPAEVTPAQVRERAVELLKRGGRDQLQNVLVNELGVGKLDQLDADQRRIALTRIESLLAEAA